ncbi:unnamed protein product [Rhodiola kirilowii]
MKVRCSFIRCLFPPTRSTSSLQTRSAQSRVAVFIENRNCMADVVATTRSAPESSSNGRICGIAKAHRKAEEKRASAEAKRETKVAKVLEICNLMRALGRDPSKRSFF